VGFAALQEKNYSESIRSLCVCVCVCVCERERERERERKKLMISSLKL
jgi:hypothetical protein